MAEQPPQRHHDGDVTVQELYEMTRWLVENGYGDLTVFWTGDGVFGHSCEITIDVTDKHYRGLFVGE